jgi:hypothetical protein
VRALALALLVVARPAAGVQVTSPEGELFAFPTLKDDHGRVLARSTYRQWFAGGELRVEIVHALADGRIVERARFRQGKTLEQRAWSWDERREGGMVRAFDVDFTVGRAHARTIDHGQDRRWEEEVTVEPGRTFAGVGLVYAAKNLRDGLQAGGDGELRAVAFFPQPRSLPVTVKFVKRERIRIAGRDVDADRLEVRPDLKGLEKLVEKLKDPLGADVWVHHGSPPMILRVRYPLVAVNDPAVVLETLGAPARP